MAHSIMPFLDKFYTSILSLFIINKKSILQNIRSTSSIISTTFTVIRRMNS